MIKLERDGHYATVYDDGLFGFRWNCCFDERYAENWNIWRDLRDCLKDLQIHLQGGWK